MKTKWIEIKRVFGHIGTSEGGSDVDMCDMRKGEGE